MTAMLRGLADRWQDAAAFSDEQLAQKIRGDGIDILIDLSMHARHNRLLTFVRKPAPIQVTYLAYCGSTGLETLHYRLSDRYLDPDDSDQKYYSEKTVRLGSYWCYPEPPNGRRSAHCRRWRSAHVTFGCLNDAAKYNELTLATWLEALEAVPGSRLILHAPHKSDRQRLERQIATGGVDPARVECIPMLPMSHYFRRYHRIDIALDPTPWPGGTTTCDALWMGVPVVSVVGKTALSRGGLSILSNVGLPELVGRDCARARRRSRFHWPAIFPGWRRCGRRFATDCTARRSWMRRLSPGILRRCCGVCGRGGVAGNVPPRSPLKASASGRQRRYHPPRCCRRALWWGRWLRSSNRKLVTEL